LATLAAKNAGRPVVALALCLPETYKKLISVHPKILVFGLKLSALSIQLSAKSYNSTGLLIADR
jgi:hypothetical protein